MSPKKILLTLLILTMLAVAGCSGSAARLNDDGNDAYAQAAYQEAWAAYQAAQIENPELAEPYYNAANALYRQGQYAEALEQMQRALAYADQEALAAQGYFNQGNTAYNLQDMAAAVEAYKQALLRNPDDVDAKYNLELALQQLQEQESQQQTSDQEDQGEESEQQNEEQQSEEQQSDSQQGEGDQDQQNQDEGQQESEQQQEGDQSNQQGEQPGEDGQEGEQSPDGQQERPGEDGQPDTPQPGQGEPAQGEPGQDQGYNVMPEPGQRLSADQARQLLAAIGRSSQTLQERLNAIFGGGNRPPVQDW